MKRTGDEEAHGSIELLQEALLRVLRRSRLVVCYHYCSIICKITSETSKRSHLLVQTDLSCALVELRSIHRRLPLTEKQGFLRRQSSPAPSTYRDPPHTASPSWSCYGVPADHPSFGMFCHSPTTVLHLSYHIQRSSQYVELAHVESCRSAARKSGHIQQLCKKMAFRLCECVDGWSELHVS